MAWFKTRKGRGYGKYDNKSHGTPHAMNSPEFWTVRKAFMERHGVEYAGVDELAPTDMHARTEVVSRHASTALWNAQEHHKIFLKPVLKALGSPRGTISRTAWCRSFPATSVQQICRPILTPDRAI